MECPPTRSFLVIVPDEGLLFEAAGVADILNRANLAVHTQPRYPAYQLTVAATLGHRVVRGRSGLHLLADSCLSDLDPRQPRDTVMVTGRGSSAVETTAIADWLRLAAPFAHRVVSVCAGALVLAEAGLLEGRRATSHWKVLDEFQDRFPDVQVQKGPIYVQDGSVWTSAGASSGFDLTLALVEDDHGPAAAREVAQDMVLYLRRPGGQSQFSRFLAQQADPGPVRNIQEWARENLQEDLAVDQLAARAAMSPRNFARAFVRQTGTTPARFVEELRLEAARKRLEQDSQSLDEVAWATGHGTAQNLRRSFERHLGVTPTDYRARFGRI